MAPKHQRTDIVLGQAIRALRQQRGLSQGDLAGRVGVDRKTINRIENGHHSTSISTLSAIAQSLDELPSRLVANLDSVSSTSA